jgi:hypothetical protein
VEATPSKPEVSEVPGEQRTAAVMVLAGAGSLAVEGAVHVVRGAASRLHPMAEAVLSPPMLPPRLRPARVLGALARRGEDRRRAVLGGTVRLLDMLVPIALDEVLRRADLTARVMQYVDLDRVVAGVDLDAAADRIDVDAVARRVDLDLAASRIDVDAVASRLDLDAVVHRLDLAGIAEEVVAAIDLPEIIRQSSGSIASDTMRGARMQGIAADEAVSRIRHRLWTRRGGGVAGEGTDDAHPVPAPTAPPTGPPTPAPS